MGSNEIFQEIYTSQLKKVWYTHPCFLLLAPFLLAAIDIAAFTQAVSSDLSSGLAGRALVVSAFTASFELAPLYIGYTMSLKYYESLCHIIPPKLRDKIFGLALLAFILGILSHTAFRVLSLLSTELFTESSINFMAIALMIVFVTLPIITSILNIIIGCLSFNPFFLRKVTLKKKLCNIQRDLHLLESNLKQFEQEDTMKQDMQSYCNNRIKNLRVELLLIQEFLYQQVEILLK